MNLTIFTDGASKGNPGPGGWGAIIVSTETVNELGGREENVTNNQMELLAAVEGLKFVQETKANIVLYTDSSYVINGITKWIFGWKRNGWVTAEGKKVLNAELWEKLSKLTYDSGIKVKWENVGGHIGIAGNERVDEIASDLAEQKQVNLYSGTLSNYGIDVLNIKIDPAKQAAKSSAKAKSKIPAYSYVSEVDGVVEVHKTWGDCESRVRNKKARFKKAISEEDEKKIVKEFSI